MKSDQIVEETFEVLGRILDEANSVTDGQDIRMKFVYRHARNIYELGTDVVSLVELKRLDSSLIIVRAMLESLFKLVAAVKQSDAAAQIIVWEVEDELSRIVKWLDPGAHAPAIRDLTKVAQHLRNEHQITSEKKWSTLACAEAAQLEDQYRSEYFYFSGHAHATIGGIILQEASYGYGRALETTLGIVLVAAAHSVLVIPTKASQEYVDKSAELLGEVTTLIQNGHFRDPVAEE